MIPQFCRYFAFNVLFVAFAIQLGLGTAETTPFLLQQEDETTMVEWGQEQNGVRCAVAFSSKKQEFPVGELVEVIFFTKNIGAQDVHIITESPLLDIFTIEVIGPDDNPAPFTPFGRKLEDQPRKSLGTAKLTPGDLDKTRLQLSRIYDMTQLGEYKVSFSRKVLRKGDPSFTVKSNVLAVTVSEIQGNEF